MKILGVLFYVKIIMKALKCGSKGGKRKLFSILLIFFTQKKSKMIFFSIFSYLFSLKFFLPPM